MQVFCECKSHLYLISSDTCFSSPAKNNSVSCSFFLFPLRFISDCCIESISPASFKHSRAIFQIQKKNPNHSGLLRMVQNIQSKSFRIAPDGHWQARPFTDRFGSSEADVLYQFPLVQGGTNVLLPTRCVDELYVNTGHPRGASRVRELVP